MIWRLRDAQTQERVAEVIQQIKTAQTALELTHLSKLQGYSNYYRVRTGDYRIGLEILGDEAIFVRCLHRKEIYRFFPQPSRYAGRNQRLL